MQMEVVAYDAEANAYDLSGAGPDKGAKKRGAAAAQVSLEIATEMSEAVSDLHTTETLPDHNPPSPVLSHPLPKQRASPPPHVQKSQRAPSASDLHVPGRWC